jgi:putative transposase
MKALGLRCRVRPARKVFTTQSRHGQLVASNQLERCFKVEDPNLVWVSDITYLAVGQKWHYLSVFLDLFSRKVVGWDLRDSLETEGVLTAFRQAIRTRRPAAGLMVHSDQGVQ